MKCPTDGAVLVMSERGGVEIDYCPECRGVWLDRGELDKIIEKAVAAEGAGSPTPTGGVAAQYEREQAQRRDAYSGYDRPTSPSSRGQASYGQSSHDQSSYDRGYDKRYDKKKKRKHWLEELFD